MDNRQLQLDFKGQRIELKSSNPAWKHTAEYMGGQRIRIIVKKTAVEPKKT